MKLRQLTWVMCVVIVFGCDNKDINRVQSVSNQKSVKVSKKIKEGMSNLDRMDSAHDHAESLDDMDIDINFKLIKKKYARKSGRPCSKCHKSDGEMRKRAKRHLKKFRNKEKKEIGKS